MSVYTIVYLHLFEYLYILINVLYVRTIMFVYILKIYLQLYEYLNFNMVNAKDTNKTEILS